MTTAQIKPDVAPQENIEDTYAKLQEEGFIPKEGEAASEPATETETKDVTEARPEWLPEKFKTVEDMAKAYAELEQKQSGSKKEAEKTEAETTEAAEEVVTKAGLDMSALEGEFAENGELSEKSLKKLTDAGISKEMVDAYIAGQEARAAAYEASVYEIAGGKDEYSALIDWAGQHLTEGEIDQFDAAVNSFNPASAKFAVEALKARRIATEGQAPARQIDGKGASSGNTYRSTAEMLKDMSDPRYGTDAAFTHDVEQKVMRSDIM